MKEGRTWNEVIVEALRQAGGTAHLKAITEIAARDPKAAGNNHVAAKVRQVVRHEPRIEFTGTPGVYRLKEEAAGATTALPCNCLGRLCDGNTFDCETCGREVPICRGVGAARGEADDCDDCWTKKQAEAPALVERAA